MEEQSIGKLFNSINYVSLESLEKFLNELTKEQSLYIITEAIEMSYRLGDFSLQEAEFLSKSIRILNKEIYNKDDREDKK